MLKARIIELVGLIPPASKIYTEAKPAERGATPPTAADLVINRRACALLDPSFPWHYAQVFAQLCLPLPAMVHEPHIKMAYDHLLNRAINANIAEAQIFQHPRWVNKRGFLEALLLLPDLRLDEVAKHTGLSVSALMLYEGVFWNVRDRLDDQMFMTELCYPQTRQVECMPDYFTTAEPRDLMLSAAFNGDLETILHLFGSRTKPTEPSADVAAKRVKSRTLAEADFVVRAGGSSSRVPVLDAARKMIVATEKFATPQKGGHRDDLMGLTAVGLTPGECILNNIERLMDTSDYDQRLAMQRAAGPKNN